MIKDEEYEGNRVWECKGCGKDLGWFDYPICPYCKNDSRQDDKN